MSNVWQRTDRVHAGFVTWSLMRDSFIAMSLTAAPSEDPSCVAKPDAALVDAIGTLKREFTLPEMIARQAALTPDSPAVRCGECVITYRELEAASARLARELILRGVAPQSRVAVLLERSTDVTIALLAILKAGGVYVPLDPSYPSSRIAYVLRDAGPTILITHSSIDSSALWDHLDRTFLLDEHLRANSGLDNEQAFASLAESDAPAYAIYTSGSTGTPKGVLIGHRALGNFLRAMRETPGLTASDVLLSVTTIAFDIAVLELFLPLTVGACVVIAREHEVVDGRALRDLLDRHGVTVMQATPVTWRMLVDAGWRNPLTKMLCGGEAMTRKLADALLARGGELWNMYGPTETTVWSSALRVLPGDGPVPLGPPILNTQFHILDEHLWPVANGEVGELCIGGAGVAIGYINLPQQTAAKFIRDPCASRTSGSARLYRTGDLVRTRPDGNLEFLGRRDQQVKIRGYRIELGEIENTLLRHPRVAQVAVRVDRRAEGEPVLYAYVQQETLEKWTPVQIELRELLRAALPAYMHPADIIPLARMPLTPNGKVDRNALPLPQDAVAERSAEESALAEEVNTQDVERKLAILWKSLLKVSAIDANANFFFYGGNSLLAIRLLECIEETFGVRLTVSALVTAPTLGEQVKLLRRHDGRPFDFRQIVRLNVAGREAPLIVVHSTGVYAHHLAAILGPMQPLIALQLFEPASIASLPQTVEQIAAEYVRLIRQEQPKGPYRLVGWCVGGVLAFEIARQLNAIDERVTFLGMIDSWAPGHQRRISVWRAWLADRSYRAQLIWADWQRVRIRQQTLRHFLRNRTVVKRLLRIDTPEKSLEKLFNERHLSGERYDRWLADYLEAICGRYVPQPCREQIVLLRSSQEPSGWFLDPLMGWAPYAHGGIQARILDGDHFTVFRGAGLRQLATVLSVGTS